MALAIAVSAGFTAPMLGKKLVSTTYRLSTSCAWQFTSSTEVAGSVPNRHVPDWWATPATQPNVTLLVDAEVERLETDPSGRTVTRVQVTRGGQGMRQRAAARAAANNDHVIVSGHIAEHGGLGALRTSHLPGDQAKLAPLYLKLMVNSQKSFPHGRAVPSR